MKAFFFGCCLLAFTAAVAGVQPPQPFIEHAGDTLSPDTVFFDTFYADTVEVQHLLPWEHIAQSELIDLLVKAHNEAMKEKPGIPGFRVHIYMDSGNRARLNTQQAQADFEEKYPEQPSYIIYEEPYFKLRAGDFRTRLDARRFLESIRRNYPAAYIVVDMINYPALD